MKKCTVIGLLALLCLALLTGCGCDHIWSEATCTQPPACILCAKTQKGGKTLDHNWQEATCTQPETCADCGKTLAAGAVRGHTYESATCTEAERCSACGELRGEPLGHNFNEATCIAPETCTSCGETRGESLGHAYEEATCTKASYCPRCKDYEGSSLGHDYQQNVCTRCSDKLIETHRDLESYLSKNFKTLHTAIGDIPYLSFNVEVNDPNYWSPCDFVIEIEDTLWCEELDSSLDYAIFYGDFLPYEDRIQAAADVLDFQMAIIKLAEEAFPGAKFEVKFYTWGYEYPNIKVGFNSTTKLLWRNYRNNDSGQSGYAATDLCDWWVARGEFLDYLYSNYDRWKQILWDIEAARPQYNLDFVS